MWQTVDSIAPLTQVEPRRELHRARGRSSASSRPATRSCSGSRPIIRPESRLVAFARQRDAVLDSEDHIKIVLDTYLDGRSGYVFAVNPNGARYDALVDESRRRRGRQLGRACGRRRRHAPRMAGRPRFASRSRVCSSGAAGRVGIQRPAPHPAAPGNRSLGERGAQLPGDARRAGRACSPGSRLSISAWAERAPVHHRRAPEDRRLTPNRRAIASQPRRDAAARLQHARVAHGQHGLRRDGGRHTAHEPDAISARLPREADVLPRGRPTSSPSVSAPATTCGRSSAGASALSEQRGPAQRAGSR